SIAPLLGNRNRNTSVRITINSFVFTAGSQTCACWRSRKSNRFRQLRFHIRSSSVSSEQSGGSTLIGYFFGTPRTWRASCTITKCITTRIESIVRSAARPPRYAPAYPQPFQPRLTVTRGGHIAAVCFRLRSPPDLYLPPTGAPWSGFGRWSGGGVPLNPGHRVARQRYLIAAKL